MIFRIINTIIIPTTIPIIAPVDNPFLSDPDPGGPGGPGPGRDGHVVAVIFRRSIQPDVVFDDHPLIPCGNC